MILLLSGAALFQLVAQQTRTEPRPIEEVKAKAETGDPACQFELGRRYDLGESVAKDQAEAVEWYRKAAEQNNALAQFNLSACHEKGEGVMKDYVEACKWRLLAVGQGEENAKKAMTTLENK